MKKEDFIKDLIGFIDQSPVSYYAIKNAADFLEENGYEELRETDSWEIEDKGKYYVKRDDTALIAFNLRSDLANSKFYSMHTRSKIYKD
ncbi:hypothetical protein [Anaerococcus sp. AGMB09787]|uniref:hypothetical protein n=1 Tax=Anaerococcus sp. AGMB09787 TaxID=2922869 RepID=UPI001FAFC3F4|nr:hypothetical protein [Anaerococcus sp. AGMB09787]